MALRLTRPAARFPRGIVAAQPMNHELFQHLADPRIRDVDARGDEPQDDSRLQELGGNPLAGADAGGSAPSLGPVFAVLATQKLQLSIPPEFVDHAFR